MVAVMLANALTSTPCSLSCMAMSVKAWMQEKVHQSHGPSTTVPTYNSLRRLNGGQDGVQPLIHRGRHRHQSRSLFVITVGLSSGGRSKRHLGVQQHRSHCGTCAVGNCGMNLGRMDKQTKMQEDSDWVDVIPLDSTVGSFEICLCGTRHSKIASPIHCAG